MERGRLAVTVAAIVLGAAAYGALVVDRPRVQSVDSRWGTVSPMGVAVPARDGST